MPQATSSKNIGSETTSHTNFSALRDSDAVKALEPSCAKRACASCVLRPVLGLVIWGVAVPGLAMLAWVSTRHTALR